MIFLPPGEGREYRAGAMHAVFKADGAETDDGYCVSEWCLEAGDDGPGPHSHAANDELFYVQMMPRIVAWFAAQESARA